MMKEKHHTFHGLFIFLLLGVFAIMSTLLVLYSAQVYNRTVERSENNNADRIMRSFVSTSARTGDTEYSFRVAESTGEKNVKFIERVDYTGDGVYAARLYCDGGKLWESYTPVDEDSIGLPVSYEELTGKAAGDGSESESEHPGLERKEICNAIAFWAQLNENGLLEASLADENGVYKVKIALRTRQMTGEGGDVIE